MAARLATYHSSHAGGTRATRAQGRVPATGSLQHEQQTILCCTRWRSGVYLMFHTLAQRSHSTKAVWASSAPRTCIHASPIHALRVNQTRASAPDLLHPRSSARAQGAPHGARGRRPERQQHMSEHIASVDRREKKVFVKKIRN